MLWIPTGCKHHSQISVFFCLLFSLPLFFSCTLLPPTPSFSVFLHPHCCLFFLLLPFLAPLLSVYDKHRHTVHRHAAVAVCCWSWSFTLCAHKLYFALLMTAIPCCSLELLRTIQTVNTVCKKNLPGISHPAVMTVCISYVCVVLVVMSEYTRLDEQ